MDRLVDTVCFSNRKLILVFQAINYAVDPHGEAIVGASYFMAYHSVLKTSEDYYFALREARKMCDNLTAMVREQTENSEIEIFPYR